MVKTFRFAHDTNSRGHGRPRDFTTPPSGHLVNADEIRRDGEEVLEGAGGHIGRPSGAIWARKDG